jgi:glycogen phosphorylase
MSAHPYTGTENVQNAARNLAARLPEPLAPLARLAFNYRWSWHPEGVELFASLDPGRFERDKQNPLRLLQEVDAGRLGSHAADPDYVERVRRIDAEIHDEMAAPAADGPVTAERPVAFFCAEFGIHRSLPLYSGGLGVLAGDILMASSDLRIPMVGIGLMYSQGQFHQRLDPRGWQHDYWIDSDPERLPGALVTGGDGGALTITLPIRDRRVVAQIWRIDVGRVPLYLLDTERPENDVVDRWITSRLYVGDRDLRLAQYALLGRGGVRALRVLGIDPGVLHLNEGHAAMAPLELARDEVAAGRSFDDAVEAARARTVFTTHTPVEAGNESFSPEAFLGLLGGLPDELGVAPETVLDLGRARPGEGDVGITVLGLRLSRSANGVSARHGQVARAMWRPLYPDAGSEEDVPIGHVTNGVHVATWMSPPMMELLDRFLPEGWLMRSDDPAVWAAVKDIPDDELWATRAALRSQLVDWLHERATNDRLAREEPSADVLAGASAFDPDALTVGFARRVAAYKRLTLLAFDPDRVASLLRGPWAGQVVMAGKAHSQDDEAKRRLRDLFRVKWSPEVGSRVAYVEDYDLAIASHLVWGCDVWVNLPRPPLEASGTSGMKSALNGGLNVSVLDGWWEEAWDETNGWGITSTSSGPDDAAEQDRRDATAFYDTMEHEVVPMFHDRDDAGIPREWVQRVKRSLITNGPRFSATRMMRDYLQQVYPGD